MFGVADTRIKERLLHELYVGAVAEQKRASDANKWYETISIDKYALNSIQGPSKPIARAYHKQIAKCETCKDDDSLNAFGNSQIF